MRSIAGIRDRRIRAESDPFPVVADNGPGIDYIDSNVAKSGSGGGVKKKTFGVGDLINAALRIIPKKYLEISVRIARIFGREIPAGFKNDETPVSADGTVSEIVE